MGALENILYWLGFAWPVIAPPIIGYFLFASAFWWRHYTKNQPDPELARKWRRRTYVFGILAAVLTVLLAFAMYGS